MQLKSFNNIKIYVKNDRKNITETSTQFFETSFPIVYIETNLRKLNLNVTEKKHFEIVDR